MIEAPTLPEPTPYPEPDEIVAPEVLNTSPDMPLSQQVMGDAEARGREHFMGLSWLDENRITHVVTDFAVRHIQTGTDHEPAGVSRVFHERRRRVFGPKTPDDRWPNGKLWPFENRVPHEIYKEMPTLSIDEYDADGNLLHVRQASEDGLMHHLDRYGTADGNVWWQEEQAESVIDHDIPIDVTTEPSRPIFDTITKTQRLHELGDWSGLTYTLNGKEVTIDREVTLKVRTTDSWKNERAFVVKRVSPDGTVDDWRTITVDKFKKQLDNITAAERTGLNMHFEVPGTPKDVFRARWIGQMLLESRQAEGVEANPEIGKKLSDLLSYGDLDEEHRPDRTKILQNPRFTEYSDTLAVIAAELDEDDRGLEKLKGLAERIKENYLAEMKKIGLETTREDESISWALWALAEQRYLADNPPPDDNRLDGVKKIDKAVGYHIIARNKQRELVYGRIGEAFDRLAVVRHQGDPHENYVRSPEGALLINGGGPVKTVTADWHVDLAKVPMANLSEVIRKDVRIILGKVTPENLELSYEDHVKLGRLLSQR